MLSFADTVIFFEHDWNPQRDNQAMDRAHRIGQRRVVNVYRLIVRQTLEERIMSLQHFKRSLADAVVNADNSNVATDLNTNQLLDLYEQDQQAQKRAKTSSSAAANSISGVPTVPDDALESASQYDDFNVDNFIDKT